MTTRVMILVLAVVTLAGVWSGCKEDPPASLFDPTYVSGPQPRITSIAPATDALAGITVLTITGQNFNAEPGKNLVFFDKIQAPVLTASATQLQVKAPILAKDSIQVKVAAFKSDLYSDPYLYKLDTAAFEKFAAFGSGEYGVGVECDEFGNLYVSMMNATTGIGVKKFTPAGVKSDYAPMMSTTVPHWKNMKFGPGDTLFCVASGRMIVFQIPPGGGTPGIWKNVGGSGTLSDLDFDANGNIWAVGSGGNVYRVRRTKVVTTFPCVGTLRAIRVYDNAVFVAGRRDSVEKVWRFPIVGNDSLGAETEYFNFSTALGSNSSLINAITFSSDGSLFIGSDNAEGIRIVSPSKASEPYYGGILKGPTVSLTWGAGAFLFQSRAVLGGVTAAAVKINTQRASAPYFGRTLP